MKKTLNALQNKLTTIKIKIMEVTGNVHYLGNEEQITASFTKRELLEL